VLFFAPGVGKVEPDLRKEGRGNELQQKDTGIHIKKKKVLKSFLLCFPQGGKINLTLLLYPYPVKIGKPPCQLDQKLPHAKTDLEMNRTASGEKIGNEGITQIEKLTSTVRNQRSSLNGIRAGKAKVQGKERVVGNPRRPIFSRFRSAHAWASALVSKVPTRTRYQTPLPGIWAFSM
jgi:hypothetical protein